VISQELKAKLLEKTMQISLHQIGGGADGAVPSLYIFLPAGARSFGKFPGLISLDFRLLGVNFGFLPHAGVLKGSFGSFGIFLGLCTGGRKSFFQSSFLLLKAGHMLLRSRQL